jgi:hypothetical protein
MVRSIEKSSDFFGSRTRDLPGCSIVPQATTLPPAQIRSFSLINIPCFAEPGSSLPYSQNWSLNSALSQVDNCMSSHLTVPLCALYEFHRRNRYGMCSFRDLSGNQSHNITFLPPSLLKVTFCKMIFRISKESLLLLAGTWSGDDVGDRRSRGGCW